MRVIRALPGAKAVSAILAAAFFATPIAAGVAAPAASYTVGLTAAEIEAVVRPHFPLTRDGPFGAMTFSNPNVVLTPGSDRLGLGMDVTADLPAGMQASARALVDGELAYDPGRREFHLREPRVLKLTAEGLPEAFAPVVADAVTQMARQQMPVIVLYRLPDDLGPAGVPLRLLRAARVEDGRLLVTLGM